jgi:fused signal recognition particle receptor
MALRDLWAKLTGRPTEEEEQKAPPAETHPAAPVPEESQGLAPGAEPPPAPVGAGSITAGDLPVVPPEMPPPAPLTPPPAPAEIAPPAPAPFHSPVPAEQPAPEVPPSTLPPGWQPSPAEVPAPPTPHPVAPPPELPPQPVPPPSELPPEISPPAPEPAPNLPFAPEPAPSLPSAPEPAPDLSPAPQPVPQPKPEPPAALAPAAVPFEPELVEPLPPGFLDDLDASEAAGPEAPAPEAPAEESRAGWFGRLRTGLSRSTARLTGGLTGLFVKRRLDEEALEELEEALITADLGVSASQRIVERFRSTRFGKEVTDDEVKEALAEEIGSILAPVARPLELDAGLRPHVVLVVGVNGTGKTTTIAKLGQQWREQGRSVTFVAGDTFRAAAVEQLQIWGSRTGCEVVAPVKQGADAAGLAFDALTQARQKGTEVLLVDTAGRLHNKTALMEELRKVVRVMQRVDPTAPHSVLLVLDATTGQNATQQCKVFSEMVNVTGLVVTKLDGSAKGGVVVALAQEFGLPVHAVGVGEKAADLRPFSARDFSRSLLGLG